MPEEDAEKSENYTKALVFVDVSTIMMVWYAEQTALPTPLPAQPSAKSKKLPLEALATVDATAVAKKAKSAAQMEEHTNQNAMQSAKEPK